MAVKDISDWQVCAAIHDMHQARLLGEPLSDPAGDVIKRLMATTRQPQKVCRRALERAFRHGLVESGMWMHGGWLTYDGILLFYLPGELNTPPS